MTITQQLALLISKLTTQTNPYWLSYADFDELLDLLGQYVEEEGSAYPHGANFVRQILPAHIFDDGTKNLINNQLAEMLLFIAGALSA